MAKLIVGLGNPGRVYEATRHNIGFMALDILADEWRLAWKSKGKGLVAERPGAEKVILLKPQTYMNLSGEAVREVCDFYKIAQADVLVLFDDLDLPPGEIRLRQQGSAGGHNGIKSIIQHLGSQEFPRLKIGIGKAPKQWQGKDWVLGHFDDESWKVTEPAIKQAVQAAECWLGSGIVAAMNRYNAKTEAIPARGNKEGKPQMNSKQKEYIQKYRSVIESAELEYYRKREQLYLAAEAALPGIALSPDTARLFQDKVLCDLYEGNAPYRPRYVLPDYQLFLEKGSEYLELPAPRDLLEAVNALLIIYHYVPSITLYPVFLGQLDELLEPFAKTVDDDCLRAVMRMFLMNVSRTMPDSFVHYNIGPRDSRVGRVIVELERELKQSEPNLTMKISADTPEDYLLAAIRTALETGKPYLVNHECELQEWDESYGVASCYNVLPRGGGSHTLVRVNLRRAALLAANEQEFMEQQLPRVMRALFEIMDKRVDYIINRAHFFEGSFLCREGLIRRERFTAMCGVFGLYQCVEILSGGKRLGFDAEAGALAERILENIRAAVDAHRNPLCFENRYMLHAQSGISEDTEETAGARIKVGNEPELYEHIRTAAKMQRWFNGGVSDIFVFDRTAKQNPAGVLRLMRAAFELGMKLFAINSADSELIRVTGYLIKRSDYEKARRGESVLSDTSGLGKDAIDNQHLLERAVRGVDKKSKI